MTKWNRFSGKNLEVLSSGRRRFGGNAQSGRPFGSKILIPLSLIPKALRSENKGIKSEAKHV